MEPVINQYQSKVLAMQKVIKDLRISDLSQGHCFMIFDDELPEEQAYYEYPDGNIYIEQVNKYNLDSPREVIKMLTKNEIAALK